MEKIICYVNSRQLEYKSAGTEVEIREDVQVGKSDTNLTITTDSKS